MSNHDLIELAVLDSMGLLEQHEAEQFEAAFDAAHPDIQAQIRDEQARLSDLEHLLPDEEPRDELRPRVLAAVRAAMDAEHQPVAGRIGASADRRPAQPRIKPVRRVSPAWRAASVALAAVSVVLVVFGTQTQQVYDNAQQRVLLNRLYDEVGGDMVANLLTDPSTTAVYFQPVSDGQTSVRAGAFHHEAMNGSSRVFVQNLSAQPGERFRIAVLDEDGNVVKEVTSFTADDQLSDVEIAVDLRTITSPLAITRIRGDQSTLESDEILLVSNMNQL